MVKLLRSVDAVVMSAFALFSLALFDARKGKVLRLTKRTCPGI